MMGECIRSNFREEDYKGRFGGDEFVVFLPGVDDKQQVVIYVNNLVEMMKARVRTPESGTWKYWDCTVSKTCVYI